MEMIEMRKSRKSRMCWHSSIAMRASHLKRAPSVWAKIMKTNALCRGKKRAKIKA